MDPDHVIGSPEGTAFDLSSASALTAAPTASIPPPPVSDARETLHPLYDSLVTARDLVLQALKVESTVLLGLAVLIVSAGLARTSLGQVTRDDRQEAATPGYPPRPLHRFASKPPPPPHSTAHWPPPRHTSETGPKSSCGFAWT